MKRFVVNVLWGLLVFIGVMVAESLVTLPFPAGQDPTPDLTLEFGLTAPLAFLVSWLLARALRTSLRDAVLRGVVWAAVVLVVYLLIGLGNGTLGLFVVWTFPLVVVAVLLGPIVAARTRAHTSTGIRTPH